MKGIVLAGGTGSRLWPTTMAVCKQLLPVYDKPLIYYPISTLMLSGIREILIICNPADTSSFKVLLGDGSRFGLRIEFAEQIGANGIAEAFLIAEDFINGSNACLVLGDNIFYGAGLGGELEKNHKVVGAKVLAYPVADPSSYGIVELDSKNKVIKISEKPQYSESNMAITGIYFVDGKAAQIARTVKPSLRGELEIISVLQSYLDEEQLEVQVLSRGTVWLDTGTPQGMNDAAIFIRVIEERSGLNIACLEEIALNRGWISRLQLQKSVQGYPNGKYSDYLKGILADHA
jgi:glucose-1-phosphate thymidylyltransferase